MANHTVLIVDDDPELARLYREMFTHRGWKVLVAVDGEDGVAQALQHLPRVIVLDLMLPKKGGLHVLKILRSLPETKDVPIIVITAYPNPEYKEEAVKAGCTQYFLKTEVSHPQLADVVDEMVKETK